MAPTGRRPMGPQPRGNRAVASTTAPKPKPPAIPAGYHQVHIPDARADADYKYQAAQLANQQAQHIVQSTDSSNQYHTAYNQSLGELGYDTAKKRWDSGNTTAGTYGAALRDTSNDFVSRGMGSSTPYVTAASNMQHDYGNRLKTANNGLSAFEQTRRDQDTQYKQSNEAARGTALRDAVSRIASQYGIQPVQVKPGTVRNINVKNP